MSNSATFGSRLANVGSSAAVATAAALLLSLWPIIGYLANNTRNGLAITDMLPMAGCVALVFCVVAWGLSRKFKSQAYVRVVLSLGVFVALFFLYGVVGDFLDEFDLRRFRYILPLWACLSGGVLFSVWKLTVWPAGARAVMLAAVVLVALPSGQVAYDVLARSSGISLSDLDSEQVKYGGNAERRPDVFFIILDAYARADLLHSQFGFDNSEFLNSLKDKGFFVVDKSRVNYTSTLISLSSTFLMNYHYKSGPIELGPLAEIVQGKNPVNQTFRKMGYSYIKAVPSYWFASKCTNIEDICIGPAGLREQYEDMLSMTPIKHLLLILAPDFLQRIFNVGDVTLFDVRDRLAKVSARPIFVFAHLLVPHPPYRFTPECRHLEGKTGTYIDNLKCANRQVLAFLKWLDENRPGAIVVIQGDHGAAGYLDTEPGEDGLYRGLTPAQYDGKAANLNVWKVPERCRSMLRDDLTSVNTFRIIFSCIAGKSPELLKNEHFVSNYDTMTIRPIEIDDQ